MSASINPDANANQQGEFGSHVGRTAPMTTHGHKPGVKVGNDAAPEFSAQTLPAGTAPTDRTFAPNSTPEVPGQANNDLTERSHGKESTKTSAADTLGGATSGDVHNDTGMGHPGHGDQTRGGLMSVGATGVGSGNQMADPGTQPNVRAVDKEEGDQAGKRGDKGEEYPQPPAEERVPDSA